MNSASNTLYDRFLHCLSYKISDEVETFLSPSFLEKLTPDEAKGLSELVFRQAESTLLLNWSEKGEVEKEICDLLLPLEPYLKGNAELRCRLARTYYHLGMLKKKPAHTLLALEALETAFKEDPSYFQQHFEGWQLWGKILSGLSADLDEEILLERALEKFSAGEEIIQKNEIYSLALQEFYWDWAETWVTLAKNSDEIPDLQKGLEKYAQAARLGCKLPLFCLNYADALRKLGLNKGDPAILQEAASLLKEGLIISYSADKELLEEPVVLRKGWTLLAQVMKEIADITCREEDLQAADHIFQEAITAIPSNADLWLLWGELYLTQAWIHINKSVSYLETALEKFTSSKMPEYSPMLLSAFLGETLLLLGLLLQELKFLKEGKTRIDEALQLVPDHPALIYASGVAHLCFGLYFSDDRYLSTASEQFQKVLQVYPKSSKIWNALFQTYLAWGLQRNNPWVVKKGLSAIARLVELRPFSPYYWSAWGMALLRLYQLEKEPISLLEESISKLQKAIELADICDPDWFFYLGCAYDLMGDHYGDESYYEKAIFYHQQVLEKIPQAANVRYHLALALAHLGETIGQAEPLFQACDLFQEMIKPDEEDDGAWCEWGYALLNLAELIYDPFHPEETERLRNQAERTLMRACELGNHHAFYYLACLYSLSHLPEASIEALRQAEKGGGLPSLEELEQDEWLEEVRQTDLFYEFLNEKLK